MDWQCSKRNHGLENLRFLPNFRKVLKNSDSAEPGLGCVTLKSVNLSRWGCHSSQGRERQSEVLMGLSSLRVITAKYSLRS